MSSNGKSKNWNILKILGKLSTAITNKISVVLLMTHQI